ncbi:MAG: hypothetical protein ACP5FL_04180 [Thermoplasmatota archaeon]
MTHIKRVAALSMVVLFCSSGLLAVAHVPYLERVDYTADEPFEVRRTIEQSIAVYAWLENDGVNPCTDVDVYQFSISEPARVYLEGIVPVCRQYQNFSPWFALVGPELPPPEYEVPFDLPEGYGAVVTPNPIPEGERGSFYEPFGGKSYYNSSVYDEVIEVSGTYYVVYWDPLEIGGDYVAILGRAEIWGLRDIIRGLLVTPLIRMDMELHVDCEEPPLLFHPTLYGLHLARQR